MNSDQPYLAGLHEMGAVARGDFFRLYLPHTAPDMYRLLWLMVVKDWKPTPETAVIAGFLNLRDTIRHLKDEGIRFQQTATSRYSPYSGNTKTEKYSFIPDGDNFKLAYGLLLRAGFIEYPPRPRSSNTALAKVA